MGMSGVGILIMLALILFAVIGVASIVAGLLAKGGKKVFAVNCLFSVFSILAALYFVLVKGELMNGVRGQGGVVANPDNALEFSVKFSLFIVVLLGLAALSAFSAWRLKRLGNV